MSVIVEPLGKCSLCGIDISSRTAKYCISCYRKCCRPCPECKPRGKLEYKYHEHEGSSCGVCKGHLDPKKFVHSKCGRCNVCHNDVRQLVCRLCNNERIIFSLEYAKS